LVGPLVLPHGEPFFPQIVRTISHTALSPPPPPFTFSLMLVFLPLRGTCARLLFFFFFSPSHKADNYDLSPRPPSPVLPSTFFSPPPQKERGFSLFFPFQTKNSHRFFLYQWLKITGTFFFFFRRRRPQFSTRNSFPPMRRFPKGGKSKGDHSNTPLGESERKLAPKKKEHS